MELLKKLIVVSFAFSAFGYYAFSGLTNNRVLANATTPPLTFHTGAPGEFVCTECHTSFPLNSNPAGSVQITGLPATYTLGQTYLVTVTVSLATARRWGFELTAIDATGNGASSAVGFLNLLPNNSTTTRRVDSDSVLTGGKLRTYISHNANGTFAGQAGSNSWSFNWVAPASSAGNITFYAAGNAANNSGTEFGDYIFTTSVVVAAPSTNHPPTFAATPDRVLGVGDKISFTVSATDQDNDPLTLSASALANATFDATSKRFTFTPAANQVGTQQVTFTVSDGKAQTQQTVSLQVLSAGSQALAGLTKTGVSKYLDSSSATQIDLTVLGTFDANATIIFNGLPMTTQPVTGGLAASLPASELTTPGAYPVRVRLGSGTLTNARALALASSINLQTTPTTDGATYSSTVAPGQIASLFGLDLVVGSGVGIPSSIPLPRSLQSTTVYINGVSAPLFFTYAGQINYQMPYSTTTGQASVVVLRDDGVAAYGTAEIAATVPALFTANAQGFGQAVALNLDYSYNGDPAANPQAKRAKKGEYVTLYGSGAGAQFVAYGTAPPQSLTINDGEAASGNPLAATTVKPVVTIGGIPSPDVFFSGLAPGFVGLWQLNVQVPPNAPSGAAVNVIITLGGGTSKTVTLAIE